MKSLIKSDFAESRRVIDRFMGDESNLERLARAAGLLLECIRSGNKILCCGNGGSMTDAMHFAEELTGRYHENRDPLPALALSDPAHLTCVANDFGFDQVFARMIKGLGKPGDILLAISTGGNSPNILKAIDAARLIGMKVIGLTGESGGQMASRCDILLTVPFSGRSDRIQEVHTIMLHALVHAVEKGRR
jgi:D-sedoheptulose 7-phosphate isomerase